MKCFGECKLQKNCEQSYSSENLFRPVKITLGLVHTGYSLSKWQAVKLTSFAPWTCNVLPFIHFQIFFFVTCLCRLLRTVSKSQNWLAQLWRTSHFDYEIGFSQEFCWTKQLFLAYYLGFWMIWLDSFDYEWNSHCNGNGLAGQLWQTESALSL